METNQAQLLSELYSPRAGGQIDYGDQDSDEDDEGGSVVDRRYPLLEGLSWEVDDAAPERQAFPEADQSDDAKRWRKLCTTYSQKIIPCKTRAEGDMGAVHAERKGEEKRLQAFANSGWEDGLMSDAWGKSRAGISPCDMAAMDLLEQAGKVRYGILHELFHIRMDSRALFLRAQLLLQGRGANYVIDDNKTEACAAALALLRKPECQEFAPALVLLGQTLEYGVGAPATEKRKDARPC
eukprot:g57606.t1